MVASAELALAYDTCVNSNKAGTWGLHEKYKYK